MSTNKKSNKKNIALGSLKAKLGTPIALKLPAKTHVKRGGFVLKLSN